MIRLNINQWKQEELNHLDKLTSTLKEVRKESENVGHPPSALNQVQPEELHSPFFFFSAVAGLIVGNVVIIECHIRNCVHLFL